MHPKLSGNGLLSTQGVQNRSQNCRGISQSEVILQYMRDPGAPAELGRKGVKEKKSGLVLGNFLIHHPLLVLYSGQYYRGRIKRGGESQESIYTVHRRSVYGTRYA